MAKTSTTTKTKAKTKATNKTKTKIEKDIILTRKEIKEKVLKTKTGQQTNKLLNIFIIIFLITFIISMFSNSIIESLNLDISTLSKDLIKIASDYLFFITGITMCYFDGKMDGLIASHRK